MTIARCRSIFPPITIILLLFASSSILATQQKTLKAEADSLFDEQKWDKAQKKYQDLAKHSHDADRSYAQYRTGLCLSKLGKYPDAVKAWEMLFAIDTSTEWSAQAMEDAAQLFITHLSQKDKGIKLYARRLETFPKYANRDAIFHKLAMQYFNDGNYGQALSSSQRLLTEYPKSPHADSARQYAMLSGERLKTQGQARATAKTETAVADQLHQMADYEQARKKYEQIARGYRATEEAQYAGYRVGLCLFQQGRYEEAVKAWDDFLKGAPRSPYSRDALARTAKTSAFHSNRRPVSQLIRRPVGA